MKNVKSICEKFKKHKVKNFNKKLNILRNTSEQFSRA